MGLLDFVKENELLVKQAKDDIKEVYFMNDLPWVIGYSGGKDSTCTTQLIIDTLIELKQNGKELNKPVYVISSDTLVETPMIVSTIYNTIDSINNLAKEYQIPVSAHIIMPEYNNSFWANLIGRGYPCPNQTFRWCTDRIKINPANEFILKIVDKYGEAIMILGVRDGESNSRDRVLESHTIEGRKLMRHTTMSNAYVFAPIRHFNIENVWHYLLNNNSPWGGNNQELYDLYKESAEDCPLIIDKETKRQATCGNSRFGCWVCTVVSKDKSLTSFINKGEKWLIPLLKYRNWLYSIRDNESMRMRRRHDGSIYFSKVTSTEDGSIVIPSKGDRKRLIITNVNNEWVDNEGTQWDLFEGPACEEEAKNFIANNNIDLSNGSNPHILIKNINDEYKQLGPGPFTIKTRETMLKKLLELQNVIGDRYRLIKDEELLEIRKLWFKQGIWEDLVSKIYYEVNGKELHLISNDIQLFDSSDFDLLDDLCKEYKINADVVKNIYNLEQNHMGYNNRSEVGKNLRKLLTQEFLHVERSGDSDEN